MPATSGEGESNQRLNVHLFYVVETSEPHIGSRPVAGFLNGLWEKTSVLGFKDSVFGLKTLVFTKKWPKTLVFNPIRAQRPQFQLVLEEISFGVVFQYRTVEIRNTAAGWLNPRLINSKPPQKTYTNFPFWDLVTMIEKELPQPNNSTNSENRQKAFKKFFCMIQ